MTFNDSTSSAFTDTGLSDGVTYFYVVRAFNDTAESADSNEASATPADNIAPQPPTGLAVADRLHDAGGAIDVTWTPSSSGDVTEQRLYRATSTGAYTTPVQTFSSTTSSYTDTGLTDGVTHFYVVRAFDGTSEGGGSNEGSAASQDDPPATPTGLTANDRPGDQGGVIELSWTPSASPDVTEQRLYRATTTGAYTTPLQVFSSTTSSYTDAGLENWIPYFYVVRAFDGTAESGDSNEATATAADNAAIAIPGASTWALLVLVAALGALTLVRRRRTEAARPA